MKFKLGNTLIEVMIALGVAVLGLLALVQLTTKSVSNSGFSQRKSQADAIAAKTFECMRDIRASSGWTRFKSLATNNSCCPNVTGFSCSVVSTIPSIVVGVPDQMISEVTVSWGDVVMGELIKQKTIFTAY